MAKNKHTDPTKKARKRQSVSPQEKTQAKPRKRVLFSIYMNEDGIPCCMFDDAMSDFERAYVVAFASKLLDELAGAERPPSSQLPC